MDNRYLQQLANALKRQPVDATWQDVANVAPRPGGQGSTPPQPAFHGPTPPPGLLGDSPEITPKPIAGGLGQTPPDLGPSGRSPYIIDRIPDLPPIDRTGQPIPIPTDFSGLMVPINNNMPFGFGSLFGGG